MSDWVSSFFIHIFPTLFLLLLLALGLGLLFVFFKGLRDAQKENAAFEQWAKLRGFRPLFEVNPRLKPEPWTNKLTGKGYKSFKMQLPKEPTHYPKSLVGSTFSQGQLTNGCFGALATAKNEFGLFFQREERGSGKNKSVYRRTIVKIDIPNTKLQLILNSKVNNDHKSGGNISGYTKKQHYRLEGEFGDFFDLYMPATTQSEALSLLAPNSMVFIMAHLADFDLEIKEDKLFLYTYRHLKTAELDDLLAKVETLLEQLRLRAGDTRVSRHSDELVAHTATYVTGGHRNLKKDLQLFGFVVLGFYLVGLLGRFFDDKLFYILWFGLALAATIKSTVDVAANARLKKKYQRVKERYQ